MLYIFASLFAALLVLNATIGRTILFPPALFCLVWLASFVGLLVSGADFLPISLETCMVYLVGALAFSGGGALGLLVDQNFGQRLYGDLGQPRKQFVEHVLNISLVVIVVGLPFYLRAMADLAENDDLTTFAYSVRRELVEAGAQTGFSIISNLTVLSSYLALAAWFERRGSAWNRWRAYVCVVVALTYGAVTGAKALPVLLLMNLFFVHSMQARRVTLGGAVVFVGVLITVFSAGLLMVNLVFTSFDGPGEMVRALARGVQNYWLGGIVAFDQIVADPQAIESRISIDRFFLQTANSLGANFFVPSIHPEFTDVAGRNSTDFLNTNTYTIYFSYFKDWGWLGTLGLMGLLGLALTLIYRRARWGSPVAVLLFGMTATGTIMTVYAESFWIGLNGYIKAILYFGFLYHFPLFKAPAGGVHLGAHKKLA